MINKVDNIIMETEDFETVRNRLQRKAFSAIVHDVKTPLTCIIGSLQMIDQMSEYLSKDQHNSLIKAALIEAEILNDIFTKMLEQITPE
jgi:K+-sensing histidine kinase KdpD